MSELYTPTGATAAAITRFTAAEAATGTFGTMHRTWQTEIADRTRFLATTGLIAFPATQVTSADANTLDDYEEGTFTATLVCGTSGTVTLTSGDDGNLLYYEKIGRQVSIRGILVVASVSSPVGVLTMGGLPFTVAKYAAAAISPNGMEATATTVIVGFASPSTTMLALRRFAAGVTADMAADIKAGTTLIIACTYHI
jgi:hypothetical protein